MKILRLRHCEIFIISIEKNNFAGGHYSSERETLYAYWSYFNVSFPQSLMLSHFMFFHIRWCRPMIKERHDSVSRPYCRLIIEFFIIEYGSSAIRAYPVSANLPYLMILWKDVPNIFHWISSRLLSISTKNVSTHQFFEWILQWNDHILRNSPSTGKVLANFLWDSTTEALEAEASGSACNGVSCRPVEVTIRNGDFALQKATSGTTSISLRI